MSTAALKVIALITMLFDHIYKFFPSQTPEIFQLIGRLAAPIFLFCCVVGYTKTSNKRSYFLRLYVLSFIVELVNGYMSFTSRASYSFNFVRTILFTLVVIHLINYSQNKHPNARKYWTYFGIYQLLMIVLMFILPAMLEQFLSIDLTMLILNSSLSLCVTILKLEYGVLFVILGIFMYLFINKRTYFILSYLSISVMYSSLLALPFFANLSLHLPDSLYPLYSFTMKSLLGISNQMQYTSNPQWFMSFALIPILLYNGQRGPRLKYLFYIFYPLHLIILFLLST